MSQPHSPKVKRDATERFILRLEALASLADALELTLPNGGIVGSILGAMANDLRQNNK